MKNVKTMSTRTLVMAAVLTALVVILQYVAVAIRGVFSVSLVLIPIVIGTATCGKKIGAWLGFVFGIVVFLTHDADLFLFPTATNGTIITFLGTIITVILKGVLCGYVSGLVYETVCKIKNNDYVATFVAAVVCPVVNTGVFLLGCLLFLMPVVKAMAIEAGLGENILNYMLFGLVGINFVFELVLNIVLAPVAVRIIKFAKKA